MNETTINDPWIVAQLLRIKNLEADVKSLLGASKSPGPALSGRVAELNFQLTLLELAIN